MKNIEKLATLFPNKIWLEIDDSTKQNAKKFIEEEKVPKDDQEPQHLVYLNKIALDCLMRFLEDKLSNIIDEPVKLFPEIPKNWHQITSFVNGSSINLKDQADSRDQKRIVIIPTDLTPNDDDEDDDEEDFSLSDYVFFPQEWVDLQDLAADYYIPVQLNLEENWLKVQGFITHSFLKQNAKYDQFECCYAISLDELSTSTDLLLAMLHRIEDTQPTWSDETQLNLTLNQERAEEILEQYGNYSLFSPRVLLNIEEWSAFLAKPEFRSRLYQQRSENPNLSEQEKIDPIDLDIDELINEIDSDDKEEKLVFQPIWQRISATLSKKLIEFLRGDEKLAKDLLKKVEEETEQTRKEIFGLLIRSWGDNDNLIYEKGSDSNKQENNQKTESEKLEEAKELAIQLAEELESTDSK